MAVYDRCRFSDENPPTWAGVEPATLGADVQRQTNYATQSALAELLPMLDVEQGLADSSRVRATSNVSKVLRLPPVLGLDHSD
ncbi:hypothetical protein TNCV_2068661 [Trichonephila clavipes]|uniref:Uncharacterized protein n=1 Tax=Trichonephila clavipes TaxID=2585209 RepID=A0A8X6W2U3_TRICX|nr:hypothetical protein TNCV_2068661 [Trichonephila clavipes]